MRTISPGTSIIICAHNRLRDLTIPCIESIHTNTLQPYELILVDDASTDGTSDYFHIHSRKTLRLEGEPHGAGIARNMGLLVVERGARIVFVDNDALMPVGWLKNLIAGQRAGGAGIVAGMPSDEARGAHAAYFSRSVPAGGVIDVNEVGFGCAVITPQVAAAVGFFDPELTWGAQDTDYCFRAKAKGFGVNLMPNLVYEHREHGTTTPMNPKRKESLRRFYRKWPGAHSMLRPR